MIDRNLTSEEEKCWQKIGKADSIIITSHVHPDGDAIGSSLALAKYCVAKNKSVRVIIDDDVPEIFSFLSGIESIENPNAEMRADLLVIVDTDPRRIGRVIKAETKSVLNIDHHDTNPRECDCHLIDGKCSSTAELLYKWFVAENYIIDRELAECLYTGLITDTVFFKAHGSTPYTFFVAGELLKAGVDYQIIAERVSEKSLADFRMSIKAFDQLESYRNDTVVGVTLDESFQELELTDDIIDSLRYIRGVEVAYLLKRESLGGYRVRMRSQTVDVSAFAKRHGGGGHPDAAGYTIDIDSVDEVKERFIRDILEWLE